MPSDRQLKMPSQFIGRKLSWTLSFMDANPWASERDAGRVWRAVARQMLAEFYCERYGFSAGGLVESFNGEVLLQQVLEHLTPEDEGRLALWR